MKILSCTGALLLALARPAGAQPSSASGGAFLSLADLIGQVESNYPDVVRYADRIQALEAKAEGAAALMPPAFSAGISRFPYSLEGMNEQGPMNQAGLMFSASQMIANGSRRSARRNYFLSLADVERQKTEWTKNELRTLAKGWYFQRYVSERKKKVIAESEAVLRLFIGTAESRYALNQASLTSIYKAKAKLEEIRNMSLMEDGLVAESNIGINSLLDRDLATVFEIDTLVALKDYNRSESERGLSRSDITAMQNMIRSMEIDREYMNRQARPDFGFEIQHMQMFGMPEQFSVMGMVTMPIVPWSSKMYKSDAMAMQLEIQAAQKEVESMQLMASRMSAEMLSMFRFTREQMDNYEKRIVPAYQENLDANLLAYRQNTGEFFVLLDAWEMLLMKKLELLDLMQQALEHQIRYEYEMEIRL
jgi:outer membrane protein TolC